MKSLILALFSILTFNSFSQNIKGKIFGANKSPLLKQTFILTEQQLKQLPTKTAILL
ncbi:MAG: hypothetical protein ACI9L6_000584 [Flavobacterium sp.]|jgi:hypothetical protein